MHNKSSPIAGILHSTALCLSLMLSSVSVAQASPQAPSSGSNTPSSSRPATPGSPVVSAADYEREDALVSRRYSRDPDAVKKLELRSLGGDEEATYDLFVMNYRGYMMDVNLARAKKLLNACSSEKCNNRKGEISKDKAFQDAPEEKINPWRSAFSDVDKDKNGLSDDAESEAKLGNKFAQLQIGKKLYESASPADKRKGAKLIYLAAQQRDNEARYLMGKIYEDGVVYGKNNSLALSWYREIALDESGYAGNSSELSANVKGRIDALTKSDYFPVVNDEKTIMEKSIVFSSFNKERADCNALMKPINLETALGFKSSAKIITDQLVSQYLLDGNGYTEDQGWDCSINDISNQFFRRRLATISPYPEYTDIIWSVNKKTKVVRLYQSDFDGLER